MKWPAEAEPRPAGNEGRACIARTKPPISYILQPGDGSASAFTATPAYLFCVPSTLRR